MLAYVLSDLLILAQCDFWFTEDGAECERFKSRGRHDSYKYSLWCANRVQKERLKHNPSSVCLHWGQMSVPYTLETVWRTESHKWAGLLHHVDSAQLISRGNKCSVHNIILMAQMPCHADGNQMMMMMMMMVVTEPSSGTNSSRALLIEK